MQAQQGKWIPGGREFTPAQIFVTNTRIIIEVSTMMGIKKDYQSLSYSDVMETEIQKNVFSSTVIIWSGFKGQIHIQGVKHSLAQRIEQIINQYTSQYNYGRGSYSNNSNDYLS